ncbi:DUF3078 domain-containing protein [Arcticibacter eurypsychrophilus]|uniref:DUF3078 domain-containing protein n=1 Tax=Arcticibacter eurypsychrophilus TaxID=1434752 RepID=UPI00084D2157|nr:DUF3078 domain-containing protein [Arcticibacter eurypsychrophilus]
MVTRLLFLLCLACSLNAFSQDIKSDTTELSELRQYPQKKSLSVRRPFLQLQPIQIPESELNLKVNYWRNWVSFGINMNQASFSDNWSGGGITSLAVGTSFNYKTDYTKGDKSYVSEVILQYGKIKNKGQLQRKTNDRLYWDNKVALKLSKSWNFFGSINFESQFDRGFAYSTITEDDVKREKATTISRFMSPGYLTESLGLEFRPSRFYSLRIGTGTARQTFVLDKNIYKNSSKNYGVDTGKVIRNELAFQLVSNFEKEVMPNLVVKSVYTMFANYEKLGNIDQRLDLTMIAKVNRFINVTVAAVVLYDDDASNKIQASQTISLGILYKFPY